MLDPLHRVLIARVALAAAALSMLLGPAAAYLEFQRVDAIVHARAEEISSGYRSHISERGAAHTEELRERTSALLGQGFTAIRLYDATHQVVLEMPPPRPGAASEWIGTAAGAFSTDPREHDHHSWTKGKLRIQLMIPIAGLDRSPVGFLEGVYMLDPQSETRMRAAVVQAAALAGLIVLIVSGAFYTVVKSLNRGMLRLSGDLVRGNIELMEVLGSAVAQRDSGTAMHNYRVCYYCIRFAEALGLAPEAVRGIIAGAFLHDVGKIGVSDAILLKQGELSEPEFAALRAHVSIGVEILRRSAWLRRASDVVRYHHEKFDGTGYLEGLLGGQIPLNARLFAIVDVFDALTSKRPYKEALPFEEALRALGTGRGRHFDPDLLDAFVRIAPALFNEVAATDHPTLQNRVRLAIRSYFFDARPELETSGCPAWVAEQCVRGEQRSPADALKGASVVRPSTLTKA